MDKDKPVSLEEYQTVGKDWFPKYNYVAGQMHGAKAEDVLKVMESLAAQAMKKRKEGKAGSIGFLNETADES